MERHTCAGVVPLDGTGLVAFTPCGHWWVYPGCTTTEEMHALARFHLGVACSFCLTAWQDATHARACGTATRVN